MRIVKGEIRAEHLLGRKVRDPNGDPVGRIEEFTIEKDGDHYVIVEYLIGPTAVLTRLFGSLRVLHSKEHRMSGYAARWNQLDLSDPDRPVLTCPRSDLRRL
jgi:hypothetical protein